MKVPPHTALMTPEEIEEFFSILEKATPQPRGELNYLNPFTLLVAVVLSAQATDKGVNKATALLFPLADTPEKMVAMGEEKVKACIKSLGFFNAKARHVIALSTQLLEKFGGEVPDTLEALMSLPGVGRKTAHVVLNTIFGHPTLAVDTHVFRVANRTGLAYGKTPEQVERHLVQRVPSGFLLYAHHWLILHGRYTCKARVPLCPQCPVAHLCHYEGKTKV